MATSCQPYVVIKRRKRVSTIKRSIETASSIRTAHDTTEVSSDHQREIGVTESTSDVTTGVERSLADVFIN
jgi:hypothetical protein